MVSVVRRLILVHLLCLPLGRANRLDVSASRASLLNKRARKDRVGGANPVIQRSINNPRNLLDNVRLLNRVDKRFAFDI